MRYGRWETLGEKRGRRLLCRCACGVERYVLDYNLKNGVSSSCGCHKSEVIIARNKARAFKPKKTVVRMFDPVQGKEVLAQYLTEPRFMSKYRVEDSGCWEWLSTKAEGRAQIRVGGKYRPAAVISFLLFVGPIKEGYLVCHTCDNPGCVNPEHLFQGTHMENLSLATSTRKNL